MNGFFEHSIWKQKVYHSIEMFLARFTDALVFVNHTDQEIARKKGWLKNAKYVAVIFNGVSPTGIPKGIGNTARSIGRQVLGIGQEALLLVI